MKVETWSILSCGIFFAVVTPIYWFMSGDPTGTWALLMAMFLALLLSFYLGVVAKQIPTRPEDDKQGEIADGAGELGFFPPYSWWPLFAALSIGVCILGVIFAWWLFLIGIALATVSMVGWVFEYYRGNYAH